MELTDHGERDAFAVVRSNASEDAQLVRGALLRDACYVEELVDRLSVVPRFLRTINARRGGAVDPTELEDLQQDVLTDVLARLADFRGEARLETWLWRFCTSHHANRIRTDAQRARMVHVSPSILVELRATSQPTAADGLGHAVRGLPSEARTILRQRVELDLTFSEIAARRHISESTVKSIYYRALTYLRERAAEGRLSLRPPGRRTDR